MRFLLIGLVGLVFGCGDARTELADRGIAYTEEAFLQAAVDGDLAVVKLFVEAGMSVNTANRQGTTALFFAAIYGDLKMVKYLVEQGADVKATGDDGATALHLAAKFGDLKMVAYLVGQGATVNAKDNRGLMAIFYAKRGGAYGGRGVFGVSGGE